jgi:hypothetical protein
MPTIVDTRTDPATSCADQTNSAFDALGVGDSLEIVADHDPQPLYFMLRAERGERQGRVGVGATGSHLGRDPHGFHDLLRSRALALGQLGVTGDAVRALCGVRHGDGDELLGDLVERTRREHRLAEAVPGLVDRRGELPASCADVGRGRGVHAVTHCVLLSSHTRLARRTGRPG